MRKVTAFLESDSGFTLIELLITIAILGLIAYSFSVMQSGLIAASSTDEELTAAVKIAESRMEESVGTGASTTATDWTADSGYEYRRMVTVLQSAEGAPTLLEVKIEVRRNDRLICSLLTHIAGEAG